MHIIFGHVTNWQIYLLKFLNFLKFKVYYLYIDEQIKLKKEKIAASLKKSNIYPLPIEFEKNISPENNYYVSDHEEFTYKKNIKIVPEKIIKEYCNLFSTNKTKKIRSLIQDFIGNKQLHMGSRLGTWAAIYNSNKILYVSFRFTCFYIPGTKNNVYKIIIPIDLINYFVIFIAKILIKLFNFKRTESKNLKYSHSNIDYEDKEVAFVVHKGLIYGSKDNIIFEKTLYYLQDKDSPFNKYNILHLDYENYSNPDPNMLWVCLKKEKTSNVSIFLKTLSASIKTLYLVKNWSRLLGWLLCIQQYNRYLKYCETLKRFKNLKLALIDYDFLCPKSLILAFEKNNVKTAATQERFIATFKPIHYTITLDTYFVASEYVAKFLKKSKFHSIENIISVGQYRSENLSQYNKKIKLKEIEEAKANGKKIVIALGFHASPNWYESYINPYVNWSAQINFLEDMIKLSQVSKDIFIVLRYKELDWAKNDYFKEILNKIKNCKNIVLSTNYSESLYSNKLCANADLIIAKHTSLADESLASGIPVLIHEYNHNTEKYISAVFDYLSSKLICYNLQDLLQKSKSLLFDNNSELKEEISNLKKTIYHVAKNRENMSIKNQILSDCKTIIQNE